MCFSMEMSAAFAAIGFFLSWWIWSKTSNIQSASVVFFFSTMELLQAVQYLFIAPNIDSPICDKIINQVLTIAGFLHICLQPYFCHMLNASLIKNPKYLDRYLVIKRLSLIGGFMIFGRFLLAYQWPQTLNGTSTEWLRGPKLCTFRGNYHLAWSIPMADPTYIIPGAAMHAFLMFAPFFALYEQEGIFTRGILFFVSGPYLASLVTSNLMEQASIWCFFSIIQIAVVIFNNREALLNDWGRNSSDHYTSLISGKKISDVQHKIVNDENVSQQDKKQRKLA